MVANARFNCIKATDAYCKLLSGAVKKGEIALWAYEVAAQGQNLIARSNPPPPPRVTPTTFSSVPIYIQVQRDKVNQTFLLQKQHNDTETNMALNHQHSYLPNQKFYAVTPAQSHLHTMYDH